MTIEQPVEVELKYRLREEAAGEHLLADDSLGSLRAAGGARSAELEDRYVDTRDGALARAGYAARLRRQRSATIVTLKSTATADGALQRRTELEGPADRTLPPSAWPASAARSLVLELCGDAPLVELVTIRQLRRKRRYRDGETVVELSLDEVEVIARTRRVDRFIELEVELVSGPEEPLLELRDVLGSNPALAPSTTSKFEAALAAIRRRPAEERRRPDERARRDGVRCARPARALATAAAPDPEGPAAASPDTEAPSTDGPSLSIDVPRPSAEAAKPSGPADEPPPIAVGRTPGVTSDDLVAEAGRKVLRFHLARLIAREPGTRDGSDPEELHGMRVATRRMRAAWRVFGDGFRPAATKRYQKRLKEVAAKLGAVRDIDVLVQALEEYRAELPRPERQALDPLLDDWRTQREEHRQILLRELDSDGYGRFVEAYRVFVQTPGAGALTVDPTHPHHVRDTAGSRIWLAYEQVLAFGTVLRWADVPTLHQLRIAGKWLRYTLEFVGEALGPGAKPLIERVVAMQDHLGLMNDAEVAATKARALLVAGAGTLTDAQTAAVGRYLASREREVARLKRGAGAPWRAVTSATFRRNLGRSVAALSAPSTGHAE